MEKQGANSDSSRNKYADNQVVDKDIETTKARIKVKFTDMAVPMERYDFSEVSYHKLFPNSKVETPLGDVKLGEHQFEKLKTKEREEYLGAVYQTLNDPIVIIETEKEGKKTKLYTKSFKGRNTKTDIVISVVVDIEGKPISISTHRRDMGNTLNKIKKGNILYEKEAASTVDTRTFNSSSSEERQPTNTSSPKTGKKSSGDGRLAGIPI